MVDAKVLEAVNFFGAIARKNGIHIHDLIVFGSSGSGTATTKSDIDIAITSGDFTGKDIFERALLTKDAEIQTVRKFKVALDVLTLTPEEYRDPASLIARHNQERNHCADHFVCLRQSGLCVRSRISYQLRACGAGPWLGYRLGGPCGGFSTGPVVR